MAMYTFKAVPEFNFDGDIVLDMFNGSGSTCVAAAEMNRRFIGIDISIDFCKMSEERIKAIKPNISPNLIIDKIKMPSKVNDADDQTDNVSLF